MINYITSVKLGSKNAQSQQIFETCAALGQCTEDFILISPQPEKILKHEFKWIQLKTFFKKGRLKYVEFAVRSLILIKEIENVYTRDILIFFLFTVIGRYSVYEAHQPPSFWVKLLLFFVRFHRNWSIVTISGALSSYYNTNLYIKMERLHVLRSAVKYAKYAEVKRSLVGDYIRDVFPSIPCCAPILLHSGSVARGRGLDIFHEILHLHSELVLVHVGGSSTDVESLKTAIANERFYASPHVDTETLISFQVSADILIFPMTSEVKTYWCCSPMKIFEYAAAAKPLISTNIGSVGELVNNNNAFIVPQSDPNAVVDAVREIMSNHVSAAERGYELEKLAIQNTWEIRAQKIFGLFSAAYKK